MYESKNEKKNDLGYVGVQNCMDQLEMQQRNFLQFRAYNYKEQMDKACQCNYAGEERKWTEDGKFSLCDAKMVFNCEKSESPIECFNAHSIMEELRYCEADGELSFKKFI